MCASKDELQSETTAESPVAAAEESFQFRLSQLFLVTCLVAAITFVAVTWGVGSLPLTIGMSLAWLNARGWFAWPQQKRTRPRFVYAAWLLIAISLLLASVRGCNQEPVPGWQVRRGKANSEHYQSHARTSTLKPPCAMR